MDEARHEIRLRAEFCAAHALVIGGAPEPTHGHNFRVEVGIEGPLDADGLVCDFHLVEGHLGEVLAPFVNRNLNEQAPFDRLNPTAELIAQHIATGLRERLDGLLGPGARVAWASVTEAPGCVAVCRLGERA